MVELVSLCGYYTIVSFLLNAFAVPLPPDALPMWADLTVDGQMGLFPAGVFCAPLNVASGEPPITFRPLNPATF